MYQSTKTQQLGSMLKVRLLTWIVSLCFRKKSGRRVSPPEARDRNVHVTRLTPQHHCNSLSCLNKHALWTANNDTKSSTAVKRLVLNDGGHIRSNISNSVWMLMGGLLGFIDRFLCDMPEYL